MRHQTFRHFYLLAALAALLAAGALLGGCSRPAEIGADLGEPFALSVDQSASISGEDLHLTFKEVVSDSRCPSDVECVWQGEVSCRVGIRFAGGELETVLTQPGLTAAPSIKDFQTFRFSFSVDPYPESGKDIRTADYRLNLTCISTPTPTPTIATYTEPELKYRLWAHFGDVFWCDTYLWPLARPDQEKQDAIARFPEIRADQTEFAAILSYLNLDLKENYTDEEKLLIFRQHSKLAGSLELTPSGDHYEFNLRVGEGEGEGYRYLGTISRSGVVQVTHRETSVNTCPICLARGTMIDTPIGPVAVEDLRVGYEIWTVDRDGRRAIGTVLATSSTPVPDSWRLVAVTLTDGRTVTASPGHPTAGGRPLGRYQLGDPLDGATVAGVALLPYGGEATFDLLPSGSTGQYWANSIRLESTLAP